MRTVSGPEKPRDRDHGTVKPGDELLVYCTGNVPNHGKSLAFGVVIKDVSSDKVKFELDDPRWFTSPIKRQDLVSLVGRDKLPDVFLKCGQQGFNITKLEPWAAQQILMLVNGGIVETGLRTLANDLYLPVDFLEEIETLLEDKRQVIFQGPPGTGKTYVAQKLAKHLAGSDERVTLVQLHPSYAYEDFVQGFRPTLEGNQAGFKLRDGPLLRAAKLARQEPDARHFLVIDEINRGSLAKVFGELYFLLEYRDEKIRLQYQGDDDEDFSLPKNLFIIGTMNTADRSIALVDLALRRRFYFVEFHPDDEPVKGVLRRWLEANAPDDMEWLVDVVEQVNELLEADRHAAIGPSYFMKENLDEESVRRIWKHSVLPYIEERRFGEDDSRGKFDLDRLMDSAAPLDCIVDGLSRLTDISREEASSRIEAEGGAAQANISARWRNWHAAFRASGLKRITLPKDGRPTLRQLAETTPRFIARVRMHLVAVIDGEAFEACQDGADMDRKPNHYWIMDDSGAENSGG